MPHLDDGLLHAYLDGALRLERDGAAEVQKIEQHLSECSECRAALERARELRKTSAAILSAAGPENVVIPAFEELQAKAKPERSAAGKRGYGAAGLQGRRIMRIRTFAWAATVVLAAMVGWYARSALLSERPDQSLSESDADARLTIPIPQTPSPGATEDSEEQNPVPARGEAVEESAQAIGAHEPTAETTTVATVGGVQAQRTPPAAPQQPSAIPERQERVREAGRVDSGQAIERIAIPLDERSVAEAPRARRAVATDAAPAPLMAQAAGGLGAEAELDWITVDEAGAEDVLRKAVPKIEGLAVVAYTTDHRAVRIVQALDSGKLVEIVAFPEVVEQSNARDKKGVAAPETTNTVVVRRDDLVIRITAELDADSLIALSQRVVSH